MFPAKVKFIRRLNRSQGLTRLRDNLDHPRLSKLALAVLPLKQLVVVWFMTIIGVDSIGVLSQSAGLRERSTQAKRGEDDNG